MRSSQALALWPNMSELKKKKNLATLTRGKPAHQGNPIFFLFTFIRGRQPFFLEKKRKKDDALLANSKFNYHCDDKN
jgi:hypothetical protein